MLMNLLVCLLSFHPLVKGDYKWFVFHLALTDVLYSISNMSYSGFILYPSSYEGLFCNISAFLHWYCICLSTVALLPVSFNRLSALCYDHIYKKISTPFGILTTIGFCDFVAFSLLIIYPTTIGYISRGSDGSCDFFITHNPIAIAYGAFLLLCSPIVFGILVYINVRIFLVVRTRKKTAEYLDDDRKSTALRETNSIMCATVIQAVVPMFVQLPFIAMTGAVIAQQSVSDELRYFLICLHTLNPIANALITFFVVKSYKRAFQDTFRINVGWIAPSDAANRKGLDNIHVNQQSQNSNAKSLPRVIIHSPSNSPYSNVTMTEVM